MDSKLENPPPSEAASVNRRDFLHGTVAAAAALAIGPRLPMLTSSPKDDVIAKIAGQHDQTVKMLHDWIALPSIAAENRGYPQGAEYMAQLRARRRLPARGRDSDQGQAGRLRDARRRRGELARPLLHVRRQAVRSRRVELAAARGADRRQARRRQDHRGTRRDEHERPQVACLAALHAFKAAGPEASGQPRARLRRRRGNRLAELSADRLQARGRGRAARNASASSFRSATRASTARSRSTSARRASSSWSSSRAARSGDAGPKHDVHSSFEAQIDSPSWHLVQALNTLVKPDGHTPAVEGFFDKVRPLSADGRRQILEEAIPKRNEAAAKKALGVDHWFKDESWHDSLVRLVTQPTINIEGLGRRLHRPRRQDDSAAPRRREDRHAPRARHDGQGHARAAQEAPRESTASATSR